MSKSKKRTLGWEGISQFGAGFKNIFPELYSALEQLDPFITDVRITYRVKHNDWLCIIKREGGVNGKEIMFSSADDPVLAFYGMGMGLRVNAWKEDRPYLPPED